MIIPLVDSASFKKAPGESAVLLDAEVIVAPVLWNVWGWRTVMFF